MTSRFASIAAFALVATTLAARAPRRVPVAVIDIRAHLFCGNTGELSPDIIGERPTTLWNTIIGAGAANGCRSDETLVVAVLRGPPGEYVQSVRVTIEARFKTRRGSPDTVVAHTNQLGIFGRDGRYYAPLWLRPTGCEPIRLTVTVVGADQPSERREPIPFGCGE